MAINNAYGARNRHTGYGPGGIVKGLSALDLVVQAGLLPANSGALEFAAWLRAPVDEIVGDLAILVDPLVDAAMAGYTAAIDASVAAAALSAAAAGTSAGNAATSAAAANQSKLDAAQIVADFEAVAPVAATSTELLAGADNAKFATALALKGTTDPVEITFTATPAPDFTATSYRTMVLTGNVTSVGAPVGMKIGQSYVLDLIEDATGSRTIPTSGNWNAAYDWTSEGFPSSFATGANKRNTISLFCYAADKAWARLTKSA